MAFKTFFILFFTFTSLLAGCAADKTPATRVQQNGRTGNTYTYTYKNSQTQPTGTPQSGQQNYYSNDYCEFYGTCGDDYNDAYNYDPGSAYPDYFGFNGSGYDDEDYY